MQNLTFFTIKTFPGTYIFQKNKQPKPKTKQELKQNPEHVPINDPQIHTFTNPTQIPPHTAVCSVAHPSTAAMFCNRSSTHNRAQPTQLPIPAKTVRGKRSQDERSEIDFFFFFLTLVWSSRDSDYNVMLYDRLCKRWWWWIRWDSGDHGGDRKAGWDKGGEWVWTSFLGVFRSGYFCLFCFSNCIIRICFNKLKHVSFFYLKVYGWLGSPGGLNNFSRLSFLSCTP